MILYIDGPPNGGEGVYCLVAETGEHLASHFCSNVGYARGDLETNRPERQADWRARFGDYTVQVADRAMHDELVKRAWQLAHDEGHAEGDEERCPICLAGKGAAS